MSECGRKTIIVTVMSVWVNKQVKAILTLRGDTGAWQGGENIKSNGGGKEEKREEGRRNVEESKRKERDKLKQN